MSYLIIGVILLVVVAPIFAILPSTRQRQQARMRKEARAGGVSVELTSIEDPDPDPERYLTATGRPMERRLAVVAWRVTRKRPQDWRLAPQINWTYERVSGAAEANLPQGWRGQFETSVEDEGDSELNGAAELDSLLRASLDDLPGDVAKIEETKYLVSVYWNERNEADAVRIITFLKRCTAVDVNRSTDNEEG